ncbi:MAG TPA: chorismate-binding protein, partial [Gammaproteobacteria bacterium]|nr:chorismate-binding protein [Gammaproteobacteria bacterium]
MTPEDFSKYANQYYTLVPLVREVLADLDTPLSTYLKLANAPYSYLFESVHGGEKWGRYSIIGLPCTTRIKVFGKKIMIEKDHESLSVIESDDPLTWIAEYQQQFKVAEVEGMPRFSGGLVGYFGYDTIRYIEPRLAGHENTDELNTPDILLMLSHEVVVFDNLRGKLFLITHVDPRLPKAYETGQQRLSQLENRLRESAPTYQHIKRSRKVKEEDFVSGFTEAGFKQAVSKAREYIKAGDIMQVVLSQRMSIAFDAPPLDLYRSLRSLNPSPYMFYLNLDDHYVVGSSPEILVRLEEGEITVRPIAG